jgi:hypothetical protein
MIIYEYMKEHKINTLCKAKLAQFYLFHSFPIIFYHIEQEVQKENLVL